MKKIKYFVILFLVICSCQEIELLDHSNPLDDGRPFVSTIKSDFITSKTAELHGEIISTGKSSITNMGHCYSTSPSPSLNNMYIQTDGSGIFICYLTDLVPETKYYFRAFATNNIGTGYGEIFSFTTNVAGEPTVLTVNSNNITSTSVEFEGDITDDGLNNVSQHGHCWSTTTNPSTNNSKTSLGNGNIGSFISNVTNLNQNTTYFYRAYATNSYGTVYGAQKQFSTTNGEAVVATVSSSNITASSVNLDGNILGIGDAIITQHGHCWSSNTNPTINNSKTSLGNATTGSYTSIIVTLSQNTTYYFKAYATNSFGTVYGTQMQFNTTSGEPTVITSGSSTITHSSANLYAEITNIGDAPIYQHGHCWSTNTNPTTANSKTSLGSGSLQNFTSSINNLSSSTSYYYRAYATNSFGTSYGNNKTFTTQLAPPPNGPCNITSVSSSPYTISITPTPNIFNFGDVITVLLYHSSYTGGQWSVYLYEDETQILSLGGGLFSGTGTPGYYSRTVTLPSSSEISPSNCYTIRTVGVAGGPNAYINISNPITIY